MTSGGPPQVAVAQKLDTALAAPARHEAPPHQPANPPTSPGDVALQHRRPSPLSSPSLRPHLLNKAESTQYEYVYTARLARWRGFLCLPTPANAVDKLLPSQVHSPLLSACSSPHWLCTWAYCRSSPTLSRSRYVLDSISWKLGLFPWISRNVRLSFVRRCWPFLELLKKLVQIRTGTRRNLRASGFLTSLLALLKIKHRSTGHEDTNLPRRPAGSFRGGGIPHPSPLTIRSEGNSLCA